MIAHLVFELYTTGSSVTVISETSTGYSMIIAPATAANSIPTGSSLPRFLEIPLKIPAPLMYAISAIFALVAVGVPSTLSEIGSSITFNPGVPGWQFGHAQVG